MTPAPSSLHERVIAVLADAARPIPFAKLRGHCHRGRRRAPSPVAWRDPHYRWSMLQTARATPVPPAAAVVIPMNASCVRSAGFETPASLRIARQAVHTSRRPSDSNHQKKLAMSGGLKFLTGETLNLSGHKRLGVGCTHQGLLRGAPFHRSKPNPSLPISGWKTPSDA